MTPRTLNSLTAITAEQGQEGEDDEWDNEMKVWDGGDEVVSSHYYFRNSNLV